MAARSFTPHGSPLTSRGAHGHSRESADKRSERSSSPHRVSRAFERRFPAAVSREKWRARGRGRPPCLARAPATGAGRPRAVCGACEQRDAAGAISGSSRRRHSRGPARLRGPLATTVPFFAACRPAAGPAPPSGCLLTSWRGLPSPRAHPPPSTRPAPEPRAVAGPRTPERGQQLPAAQVS